MIAERRVYFNFYLEALKEITRSTALEVICHAKVNRLLLQTQIKRSLSQSYCIYSIKRRDVYYIFSVSDAALI